MKTAAQIRREFVDFFGEKGHTHVPSSPVVPYDDPTLLFTNAGMNQFKPIFLGQLAAGHAFAGLKRAANSQKCIRAGGKHNDLDDVGHDTYHHTFFEMLGNWSFGDYFKAEAIEWAWELLVQRWGLEPGRLHATYFGGLRRPDGSWELEPDHEARELWKRITGMPDDHIHPGNMKDNFWEMGDSGPCGPCSEIHIDLTPDRSGGGLVNAGDARVIEIWNLVFIQFNRRADGALDALPARHVDTGMGFERVTAVVQGKRSNYDTDVFAPIFDAIREVSGAPAYGGRLESDEESGGGGPAAPRGDDGKGSAGILPVHSGSAGILPAHSGSAGILPAHSGSAGILPAHSGSAGIPSAGGDGDHTAVMRDVAYRVIADHIRTLTFALADGAVPDNEGRGYVLRRILRRAVRYGWQYLNLHEPFLHKLAPTVVRTYGEAFPELPPAERRVVEIIGDEEHSFGRTLERGIALFNDAVENAAHDRHREISGADAFKLHDTYGFPIDLTQIMASERGLQVDVGEYERLMEEARRRARAGGKKSTGGLSALPGDLVTPFGPTDDEPKYEGELLSGATVRAMALLDDAGGVIVRDDVARPITPGTAAGLVLDKTCFYAEQGGQVADRGVIGDGSIRFDVEDTRRYGDTVVHFGTLALGRLSVGDRVSMRVDARRAQIRQNHTATHVLNWALRDVLGDGVQQKGSLVDADKLRFDFSHGKPLSPAELERIASAADRQIAGRLTVYTQVASLADSMKINGLRAVFGEKYPGQVRVVSIGAPVEQLLQNPADPRWRQYSIEFCGGTHVQRTDEIGPLVITTEEGVAKGVRRIVAVSGDAAARANQLGAAFVQQAESLLAQARGGGAAANWPERLAALQHSLAEADLGLQHRARVQEILAEVQGLAKEQKKAASADAAERVRAALDEALASAMKVGAATLLVCELPDAPIEALKQGADIVKVRCGSVAALLATRSADKVTLLAAMSDDLVKRGLRAGDLVKAVAPIVGGGGGGPPTMAQAGGKEPGKLTEALAAALAWMQARIA